MKLKTLRLMPCLDKYLHNIGGGNKEGKMNQVSPIN